MDEPTPVNNLNLAAFVRILARRWHVVLLCALIVPAVSYYLTSRQDKRYEATAKVLFRDSGQDRQFANTPGLPENLDQERQAATIRDLLQLPAVARGAAEALGGGTTAGEVAGQIGTGVTGESDIYSVEAEASTAAAAARVANTYAKAFVDYREAEDRKQIAATRQTLTEKIRESLRRDPVGGNERRRRAQLSDRIAELRIIESLQDGDVEVVQRATAPSAPFSPKPARNTAIGFGLGLLLGVGLALLFSALDRRLRSTESVESAFERPVLGAIPKSRALAGNGGPSLPAGEREAFRMLRANLRYYNDDRDLASVLVTSAALGEGKSTVAWNLAVAGAEAGAKVLLVEADMRRPVLARRFGVSPAYGLSDVLRGSIGAGEAVQQVQLPGPESNGSAKAMDVIFGGKPLSNPADSIESGRMASLISGAERRYNLIVVDAPPLSVIPDAIPLTQQVDGVIVVLRLGQTTRDGAARVRAQLENLGVPPLGVVVNSIPPSDGRYGYAYRAAEGYAWATNGSEQS
jgi:capsular exopolysaccharide synthesis family protein